MGLEDETPADGEKKGITGTLKYYYEDEKKRIAEKGISGAVQEHKQ